MPKKYSWKFWIFFTLGALVFLLAWFVFLEVKNGRLEDLRTLLGLVPMPQAQKTDLQTVIALSDALLDTHGEEKTYLLLFQNNLELRPGGGFIGSFGILKIKDGGITHFSVHDTGNFDGRIPSTVAPPYPMQETLKINAWKLRDSNYSPDFLENAKQAENFYYMGQGTEKFNGVIAVTTNVLTSFLKITGPVQIEGFPGTYGADNAILDLEYQVEQGYLKQDIDFGERKSFMGLLGLEILKQAKALPVNKKYALFQTVLEDLRRKDIQLLFKDEALQDQVRRSHWDGAMDTAWSNDYLFLVDANLNSFKSDYFVKRAYDYSVDLSGAIPKAVLHVTYTHTAKTKDWFTKDYQAFLRVYVPAGSHLDTVTNGATAPVYGEFSGKKYFGVLVQVPLGTEKTLTFEYTLPQNKDWTEYDLKLQKQPGLNDVPVHIEILQKNGSVKEKSLILNRDTVLSDIR